MREVIKEDYGVIFNRKKLSLSGDIHVDEQMKEKVKKTNIFKRLHASKKKQVLFCVVSMVMLITVYSYMSMRLDRRFEVVNDDFSWMFQVDSISEVDEKLVVDGWAFQLGEDATADSFEIVLIDIKTEERYYPKMQYHARNDVNEYFLCEYDYTQSGFTAEINLKKLDLENSDYEVILRPAESKKGYATSVYYTDGKMMFVNPNEYVPLKTEGTDLEKITENGVLRVYRPDFGMYVYQYEGDFYWIAEGDYLFVDGNTLVEYQLDTTQIQRLPQERKENGWFWANLGFWFKDNELQDWDSGPYRVAKMSLPNEYSVTKIWTGNCESEWIWISNFRPWYEFE